MGYIYNQLKDILSIKGNYEGGIRIKDWSPNEYRCIIVGLNFIFVAKFLGAPRYRALSQEEVKRDLMNYSMGRSKGAIHNLLTGRQFSCLEEIFFDTEYKRYTALFDINMYVSKALNMQSRLRYFGYFMPTGQTLNYLMSVYSNCSNAYCITEDKNRPFAVEFKKATNEWYKNHNLRPQYYMLDREGGSLDIYFKKCESQMMSKIVDLKNNESKNVIVEKLVQVVGVDVTYSNYLIGLGKAIKYVRESRILDRSISTCYANILKGHCKTVVGLSREWLCSILDGLDMPGIGRVSPLYGEFRVFDKYGKGLSESTLEGYLDSGFLRIPELLDKMCVELSDTYMKSGSNKLLVNFYCKKLERTIPDGAFRKKYIGGSSGENGDMAMYVEYISNLIGVDVMKL